MRRTTLPHFRTDNMKSLFLRAMHGFWLSAVIDGGVGRTLSAPTAQKLNWNVFHHRALLSVSDVW